MKIIVTDEFNLYGFFIVLAIGINIILTYVMLKKRKIKNWVIASYLIYEIIGIVLGAKILFYLTNFTKIENLTIYSSGFSSYGGVIGGIIMAIMFGWQFKIPISNILKIQILILPLMYAVAKLGCFFAGCCYGIEYSFFGSVVYMNSRVAPDGLQLFPVQLVETIVNLIIFLFLIITYKKYEHTNITMSLVFVLCGISKLILECFRSSWNWFEISTTQWISITFLIIGIIIYKADKIKLKP